MVVYVATKEKYPIDTYNITKAPLQIYETHHQCSIELELSFGTILSSIYTSTTTNHKTAAPSVPAHQKNSKSPV